ncbi:hypothetical protein [Nocardioides speluncae]|uniref:hypothetical protein n=1 Tax=Nocardioides speluncae TaxID=2670337 RepID=UPI000D699DC1|nr:hypothetical protein [Nocardioides speluncae]
MRIAATFVATGLLLAVGSSTPTVAGPVDIDRDDEIIGPTVEQLDPRVEACILPVVYRGGPLEPCAFADDRFTQPEIVPLRPR